VTAPEGNAPPFRGAIEWLNSAPLSASDLRDKVVLVNFWTYSCINWIRSLPYVRAWHEAYHDHGLVVVGVHTPEFEFETDIFRRRRICEIGGGPPGVAERGRVRRSRT